MFSNFGTPESRPSPRPYRVLVVDDNRDTVLTLMALLRDEGYEVQGAYDGHSALNELTQFDPDVIVADIDMPGISGWDVAREVRQRHRSRPMLIAITGTYVAAPDAALGRAAGFSHFFVKPCDPRKLLQALSAMVRSQVVQLSSAPRR